MSKRGHEINLASGVMFSPQQEDVRLKRERVIGMTMYIPEVMMKFGIFTKHFKRPSLVHEFQFFSSDPEENVRGPDMVARRSVNENDLQRKGVKRASVELITSVLDDLGIEYSHDQFPDPSEPVSRWRVDTVGAPPETQYRERIPVSEPKAKEPEPVEVVEEEQIDGAPQKEPLPFNDGMTIKQLKDWASENLGGPVPSTITRKGDILEYLANEYSDRG